MRNVLITGAAGALGRAVAIALAARGAQVLLTDRDLRGLEASCSAVEAGPGSAPGYCHLDLADAGPEAFASLVAQLREAYGALDGLVHCAARLHALQPLDMVSPQEWLATMQVNLNAAWLLSLACLDDLRTSPGAALVFILDGQAAAGRAYRGPYGVAKAGLRGLALGFAEELEGSECRVFGVDPGPFRSNLRSTVYHGEFPGAVPSPDGLADRIARLVLDPGERAPVLRELGAA